MSTSNTGEKAKNCIPLDCTELDLAKIKEFIQILENFQRTCEENENYLEAEAARYRIGEFRKIEEAKFKIEAGKEFDRQKALVKKERNEELQLLNQKLNDELDLLTKAFTQQESQLIHKHEKEATRFLQEYEINCQKKPKPSSEILNLIKIKEISTKQKEYQKAHDAFVKIEKLEEMEKKQYSERTKRNLEMDRQKLLKRQEAELNGFKLKKKNILLSFEKTKDSHLENLNRKYISRFNELDNAQKVEQSNLNRILKGLSKPNTKIQNIIRCVSSLKSEIDP